MRIIWTYECRWLFISPYNSYHSQNSWMPCAIKEAAHTTAMNKKYIYQSIEYFRKIKYIIHVWEAIKWKPNTRQKTHSSQKLATVLLRIDTAIVSLKTHSYTQLFLYCSGGESSVKFIRSALEIGAIKEEQRGVVRFLVAWECWNTRNSTSHATCVWRTLYYLAVMRVLRGISSATRAHL